MKKQIDLFELRREVFHILVGIGFVLIMLFLPWPRTFLFFVLIFGGFMSFLSTRIHLPLVGNCLCLFERDCNRGFPGRGVLFFLLGVY